MLDKDNSPTITDKFSLVGSWWQQGPRLTSDTLQVFLWAPQEVLPGHSGYNTCPRAFALADVPRRPLKEGVSEAL